MKFYYIMVASIIAIRSYGASADHFERIDPTAKVTSIISSSSDDIANEACDALDVIYSRAFKARKTKKATLELSTEDKENIYGIVSALPDINATVKGSSTILIYAAEHGYEEAVHILLTAGAEINLTREEGITALMGASYHRNLSIVKALLMKGADINAKSLTGNTALISTLANPASFNRIDIVDTLLMAGADTEAHDMLGQNALMIAARQADASVIDLLIKAGANMDALDKEGKTALEYASCAFNLDTVIALTSHGAPPSMGSIVALRTAFSKMPKLTKKALRQGAWQRRKMALLYRVSFESKKN